MITLSKLICSSRHINPINGSIKGICVYCGQNTNHGHNFKPTGQFTTYQHIQGGTCICSECNEMKKSQDYRRSMWVVNETEFSSFKSHEAKNILINPPMPPFVMYFTKTWKKQGWPQLVNRINMNQKKFIVGFDYNLVLVDSEIRDKYLVFSQELVDLGISKTELYSGNLKGKSYETINFNLLIIDRLKQLAGNPLWELCVFVTRKEYDK